jgi:hypothetical protein
VDSLKHVHPPLLLVPVRKLVWHGGWRGHYP